jgi:hypothetical protein
MTPGLLTDLLCSFTLEPQKNSDDPIVSALREGMTRPIQCQEYPILEAPARGLVVRTMFS